MKKKNGIPNNYTIIDLGDGNSIKKYDELDIIQELNSETPIISVQKSVIDKVDEILQDIGIKDNNQISIKEAMGRSGFTKIISKDLGTIGLLATKGSDSALAFSNISDYYLGGSDIGENIQAREVKLKELGKIAGESLWEYKTELLLIIGLQSLQNVLKNGGKLSNFELDMIATKFTPTLTKKAINNLPVTVKKPGIITVDSNSELAVQQLEILNKTNIVGGVEIVQSGVSLIATNNAFVRDNKIISPSLRNKQNGGFDGEIISEIDPESQVGKIAASIQTQIDVILYKIINDSDKPMDFIKAILEKMK